MANDESTLKSTVGLSEIEILKGLIRVIQHEQREGQREQRESFSKINGDMTVLVESARLLRDRVANIEARVAIATESRHASYERTGVAEARQDSDLAGTLERIEAALQRLEQR